MKRKNDYLVLCSELLITKKFEKKGSEENKEQITAQNNWI